MEFVPYARQIWTTPIVDSKKDMKYKVGHDEQYVYIMQLK